MTPTARIKPTTGRAYGYVRVSTDEQARSGLGIEAQRATIQQAATRAGLTVVAVFTDDGISGSAPPKDRAGLSAALAVLRRGDALIVARRDRLHRDVEIAVDIDRAIRKSRARLIVADAPETGDETADKTRTRVDDFIAEMYRNRVKQATRAALAAKRARGERVGRFAPMGYALNANGRLEPNEAEQAQLRIIAECRAAGFSWDGTARELARLGLRTRSGRPWTLWNVRSVFERAQRLGTLRG